jgi:hypothetical protein
VIHVAPPTSVTMTEHGGEEDGTVQHPFTSLTAAQSAARAAVSAMRASTPTLDDVANKGVGGKVTRAPNPCMCERMCPHLLCRNGVTDLHAPPPLQLCS